MVEARPDYISRVTCDSVSNCFALITISLGPAIGLEFNSSDCVRITTEAVRSLCGDSLSSIYVSPNPMKASQDIDAFYNFVDMCMT